MDFAAVDYLTPNKRVQSTHQPVTGEIALIAVELRVTLVRSRGPNTARHTFISQLLTPGIAKEWIIRKVAQTSIRTISKSERWMAVDAVPAGIVSLRLETILRQTAWVEAVWAGIVSTKFPETGNSTGQFYAWRFAFWRLNHSIEFF